LVARTPPRTPPGAAPCYRLDFAGKSLCYITDTEHVLGKPDQNVLGLIEGADLVIYDCTYTDEEFPEKISWGHSTWQEGVRLCRAAGAKRLAIFHHDPDHDDDFMEKVEKEARETWSGAFAAREDMSVVLA
jgi:phosphoribosyl 1,2-cyclic phosphodiesterase